MTIVPDVGKDGSCAETAENLHLLIARFAADVTTDLEPLTVTFADQSSGEVSARAGDLDSDGTIGSPHPNPMKLFDLESDDDVDLGNFAIWQNAFTGN